MRVFSHFVRLVSTCIVVALLLCSIHAQAVMQIPGIAGRVTGIQEINDKVWIATTDGLYFVNGNDAKKIASWNEEILRLDVAAGKLWISTNERVLTIKDDAVEPIIGLRGIIKIVQAAAGQAWIGTSDGLFSVEGNEAKRVPGIQGDVAAIRDVAGQVWIGSSYVGVYRIAENVAQPIAGVNRFIDPNEAEKFPTFLEEPVLESVGGRMWFGGHYENTYVVAGGDAKPITGVHGFAQIIQGIDGQVWIATDKGVYVVDTDKEVAQPIFDFPALGVRGVRLIKEAAEQIWIGTYDGLYHLDKSRHKVQPVDGVAGVILTVEEIGGQVWIGTDKGVYTIEKGKNAVAKQVSGVRWGNSFKETNGYVWISSAVLYRVEKDTMAATAISGVVAPEVRIAAGKLWMQAPSGAYRLDEDVSIHVSLDSSESRWKTALSSVTPKDWLIEGTVKASPHYQRRSDRSDPYGDPFAKEFFVIVTPDKATFDEAIKNDAYAPARDFERSLSWGSQKIYISVRDKFGNTMPSETRTVVVLPGAATLPTLLAILWPAVVTGILALAPYSKFCHDIVMNPWLRNYGSLGLMKLAITVFPSIRRHVLRRYLREIRRDTNFSEWRTRFVYADQEFLPQSFGARLESDRRVLLHGQSGIGKTSYMRHLTACYAEKKKKKTLPRKVVPIFIPLASYPGGPPEQLVYDQLSGYGQMTDNTLNEWFLKQGGFLIFLDGLNEIADSARKELASFVSRNWRANYFCLSSQQSYPEFSGLGEVNIEPLGKEKVEELLKQRLGEEKANEAIKKFTDETYKLYSIPRDLEFAIEIIQRSGTSALPQSRSELYKETLAPIMDAWASNGHGDYAAILCQRAYEMLCQRDSFFDSANSSMPDEIRIELYQQRYLVQRGDHYQFRHDLVRSYLAAQFFAPRWRTLLGVASVEVDANWVEMLKFAIPDVNGSQDVEGLLHEVLSKSPDKELAGVLFNWETNHPSLCQSWGNDFKLKYAEALLVNL